MSTDNYSYYNLNGLYVPQPTMTPMESENKINENIAFLNIIMQESYKNSPAYNKTELLGEHEYKPIEPNYHVKNFINDLENDLKSTNLQDKEKWYDHFVNTWSLTLKNTFRKPKQDRENRIKILRESLTRVSLELPNEKTLIANLNVLLVIALLAEEMDHFSPDKIAINNAQELLKENQDYSKIAEKFVTEFDFNEWKTSHFNEKEMKNICNGILAEIESAGFKDLVAKRDLKEVFKMMNPTARKKADAVKALKIIAALLTFPIVWSAVIAIALAVLFVAALVALALIFVSADGSDTHTHHHRGGVGHNRRLA